MSVDGQALTRVSSDARRIEIPQGGSPAEVAVGTDRTTTALSQDPSKTITPLPAHPSLPMVAVADFSGVFDAVSPRVVGIAAGRSVDARFRVERTGTGFVWDKAGHVVTNAHLVGDAPLIRVRSADGRVFRGTLVGLDAATDLAVV